MDFFFTKNKVNAWAEEFKSGSEHAATKLFDYFYPSIFRFVYSRTRNRDAAEDISQEVFLKIARSIRLYSTEKGNFTSWIWQIVRNTLADHFRKSIENTERTETNLDIEMDSFGSNTDISNDMNDIFEIVKLYTKEEQELFNLRFISGLPYNDISSITGKKEEALRIAIHRLTVKIKNDYGPN